MRGDVVYRIYGVHEGREKDNFLGLFRTIAGGGGRDRHSSDYGK